MRKQACRQCKVLADGEICPKCKGSNMSPSWQGRITFMDTKRSFIAHKMGIDQPGEYALKVR